VDLFIAGVLATVVGGALLALLVGAWNRGSRAGLATLRGSKAAKQLRNEEAERLNAVTERDALIEDAVTAAAERGENLAATATRGPAGSVRVKFRPTGNELFYLPDLPAYKAAAESGTLPFRASYAKPAPRVLTQWSNEELRSYIDGDSGG
jgi:hypothetical protein